MFVTMFIGTVGEEREREGERERESQRGKHTFRKHRLERCPKIEIGDEHKASQENFHSYLKTGIEHLLVLQKLTGI
jgi:hypothetical protein